jgi:hypothetical protein
MFQVTFIDWSKDERAPKKTDKQANKKNNMNEETNSKEKMEVGGRQNYCVRVK